MYVELKNINKNYGDYKASDDVNFGIERGKLVALLGPSGSGKQRFCECWQDWNIRTAEISISMEKE